MEASQIKSFREATSLRNTRPDLPSSKLLEIASRCATRTAEEAGPGKDRGESKSIYSPGEGLSGRSLRRLPLLAHARKIRSSAACSVDEMLEAMLAVVSDQH